MDRRTFVTASVGMAVFGGVLVGADGHRLTSGVPNKRMSPIAPALILIDMTLAESHAYAEAFDAARPRHVAFSADVGTLWHTRLREWAGPISGMLRPSDCFVLRTLSLANGRAFRVPALVSTAGESIATITHAGPASAFLIEAALPLAARGA